MLSSVLNVCRAAFISTVKTAFAFSMVAVMAFVVTPLCGVLPSALVPKKMRTRMLKESMKLNVSLETLKVMWRVRYRKALCSLRTGMKAPDLEVLSLEKKRMKLLDFQKAGRMLVINFGSCT